MPHVLRQRINLFYCLFSKPHSPPIPTQLVEDLCALLRLQRGRVAGGMTQLPLATNAWNTYYPVLKTIEKLEPGV